MRHIRRCGRCGADFNHIGEELIKIIRQGEAAEREQPPPLKWVDSKRLQALYPWLESAESNAWVADPPETPPTPDAEDRSPLPKQQAWRPQLIVIGLSLLVATLLSSHQQTREPIPSRAMTPPQRLVSPRFTGERPWRPLLKEWPHLWEEQQYVEVNGGRPASERRGRTVPGASGELAVAGVANSLAGHPDSGVELLRRAAASDPESPEVLSDLGAALLARAEIGERRRQHEPGAELEDFDADLPAALEAIDHALEIAPTMREALFNRALALERLYLRRSARDAWQAYLDVDDGTSWTREARERMEAIVIPTRPDPRQVRAEIAAAADGGDRERLSELVDSQRQLARASVPEDLLPGWAQGWLDGDQIQADRQLSAARLVADEWEAQTTDETLRDAVAEVERAAGETRERLAEAYRNLGEASRALAEFELDSAQGAAERAMRSLPRRSPAVAWAELIRVACMGYRGGDIGADAAVITRDSPRDLASVARAHWIKGVLLVRRGNLALALSEYRHALIDFEQLDELESAVALHQLIGEAYSLMGETGACWKHRRIALEQVSTIVDRERAMSILRTSAILALHQGNPRVAADFLAATLAEPDMYEAGQLARTYIWRGRVLRELGHDEDALRDLHRADAWLIRAQPFERRDLVPDLDFALGLTTTDPDEAVRRLSRAFVGFRARGVAVRLPDVLLARARAHLRAGDSTAADADLQQGLAMISAQAGERAGQVSAFPLNRADELVNERVSLALAGGRIDDAFAVAEMGRVRFRAPSNDFPDRVMTLRPAEVAAALDPDTTLLVFSWLPDALRVWRLERGNISFSRIDGTPRELGSWISAVSADLEAGAWTAATRETATKLYSALLAPAGLETSHLVIVPDDSLHTLPFGALINPASGRFLIEERELTIAPSVSAFLRGHAEVAAHSSAPTDALVVGDPTTDPSLFPGIRPLSGARQEAREVAALYPRRELLVGAAATREAFLAALSRRSVVHFAGHAVPNRVAPERSSLPLAEDPSSPGLLVAADIARLDLTGTYTVVLSGCETGVGSDGGNERPLSLAHAFLAAGVPDVVASLWSIADVPSAPFMTAFHRRLRSGDAPSKALRAAQLSMLHSRDAAQRDPSVWAAFEAFGG